MTLVYLDTETTGVDPGRHEVWEIAYAVDDGPIQASCVSHQLARADPEALRIGRYFSRVRRGDHWHLDAYLWELDLQAKLSGATLVGANPAFDAAFLTARWGVAPWRYRLLDVEAYAMPALDLDRPRGLAHIAEQLEVLPPDHTAAGDVHTLRECHRTLLAHYGAARTVLQAQP